MTTNLPISHGRSLCFLLIMVCCLLTTGQLNAQTGLNVNGLEYEVNHTGTYEDFLIPTSVESGILDFLLRGGDGGKNRACDNDAQDNKSDGGKGATITVQFPVGNEMVNLEPGGTIRFVVGQRGESQSGDGIVTFGGGAGGGGGTAILYKKPGATIPPDADTPALDFESADTAWILLAVAGGGGGSFAEIGSFEVCNASAKKGTGANTGTSGKSGGGNNKGGTNGNGGEIGASDDGGAGGGYLTNGDNSDDNRNGKRGGITGGAGGVFGSCGSCRTGGFGYGGGGAGNGRNSGDAGGGGGGGFSGGGGGNDGNASANNGGGAGSYVNAGVALVGYKIDGGGSTDDPDNGRIKYSFRGDTIITDGSSNRVSFNGRYQDLVIPADIDLDEQNAINLILIGGDGGKAKPTRTCTRRGGSGAGTLAQFKIGNGNDELKPGGTLRFIAGGKGNSFTTRGTFGGGAGGGGGTAVLYKSPNVIGDGNCSEPSLEINDACWTLLAVAAGGSGGYGSWSCRGGGGEAGNATQQGTNGAEGEAGSDAGSGGSNGTWGEPGFNTDNIINSGGGGGYLPISSGTQYENSNFQGQPGVFTGGEGGASNGRKVGGGFGYGGGGSGAADRANDFGSGAGGGGGGFSGGGGGAGAARGGGGGSWYNTEALTGTSAQRGTDRTPDNGFIYYNTFKTDIEVGGVLAPVANCKPSITIEIPGDEEVDLTPDMIDNGSYDPNSPARDLTYSFCFGTPGVNEICFPSIDFGCNTFGASLSRRLKVSNGVRDSYCTFIVEIEQGEPGTLSCPDPVTINPSGCDRILGSINGINEFNSRPACNDSLGYYIIRPDQSIDTYHKGDNFNLGIDRDTFELGISTVVYNSFYTNEEGDLESQSCSFTVTVTVGEDLENEFMDCPDDIDVSLNDGENCFTTVTDGDMPNIILEPNYNVDDGDLFWRVTSSNSSANVTEGSGILTSFDFEGGRNQVEYILNCGDNVLSTCSFYVDVEIGGGSNDAPEITCVPSSSSNPVLLSVYDDIDATDPFIIDQLLSSATDDCYIAEFEIPGLNISCTNVGVKKQILVRATDAFGVQDECLVWVRMADDIGITCPDNITVPTTPGTITAPFDALIQDPTTRYLCHSSLDLTIEKSINGQFQDVTPNIPSNEDYEIGLYRFNLTHNSSSGQTSTCSYEVTVADQEPPNAVAIDTFVWLSLLSTDLAEQMGSNSTDNFAIASYALDGYDPGCPELGLQLVTLMVTDEAGNTGETFTTIDLIDDIPPVINSCPQDQSILINTGTCQASLPDFTEEVDATDNCDGPLTFNQFPEEGALIDYGTSQTVEIRVFDSNVEALTTCTFNVTVQDDTAPMAVCQDKFIDLDENGSYTLDPNDIDNNSSDNCGDLSFSLSQSIFSCADVGTNAITLSVFDDQGNESNCIATVTVNDFITPVVVCNNLTAPLDASGNASITADDIDDSSSDACGLSSKLLSQSSFTCSDIGAQMVTLTVTDPNGNSSSCDATVTVIDNIAPVAICVDQTINISTGPVVITPQMMSAGSFDNCGIATIMASQTTFDCSDIGINAVTITLGDGTNTSTCIANITVTDNTPPFIDCAGIIVDLDANGQGIINASDLNDNNDSSDACGLLGFSFDEAGLESTLAVDCNDIGTFDDFVYVTDVNGNVSAPCPVSITVRDVTTPTAQCKDITVQLNANGEYSLLASDLDNGSWDACAISMFQQDIVLDCENVGLFGITVIVSDASGNSSTCQSTITVIDNIAPVALCQNLAVSIDADNLTSTISPQQIDNGSSDACGIGQFTLSQNTFDCDDEGANTVTLTVEDVNGNQSSCNATVTVVIDDTLPEAWSSSDIGIVSMGNDYAFEPCGVNSGQFYVTGSGNNAISSTTDNVAFASQSLCGDGYIIAKIESVDPNGYGGVMIRENTDAGSKQIAIFSNQSNILRHEVRYTTNGFKQASSFFKPSPLWLKLERQGDWVFAYYSTTGSSFQHVHGVFVPMQNCIEIGLASFTNFPFAQTETVFSNVSTNGNNGGFADIPSGTTIPSNHNTAKPSNLSLFPNPTSNEFTLRYTIPSEVPKTMVLYNTVGQQVAIKTLLVGQQILTWDVSALSPGVYWLRVDEEKTIHKIIVSR